MTDRADEPPSTGAVGPAVPGGGDDDDRIAGEVLGTHGAESGPAGSRRWPTRRRLTEDALTEPVLPAPAGTTAAPPAAPPVVPGPGARSEAVSPWSAEGQSGGPAAPPPRRPAATPGGPRARIPGEPASSVAPAGAPARRRLDEVDLGVSAAPLAPRPDPTPPPPMSDHLVAPVPRVLGRRPRVRKVTRVVRHVDPWSVFKVAAIFSLVLYGVLLTAGVLLWNVANATGTIDNLQRFFESFGWASFEFKGDEIFRAGWVSGLFGAIGLTGAAVLGATLFNLITDLVGGVRLTVLEEEVVERTAAPMRRFVVRRPGSGGPPPDGSRRSGPAGGPQGA